jgi:serine/threonine protein phosphatase PrpC
MKTGNAGQNGRGRSPPSTEDRSFIRELPGEILLAGVLDGHSGSFTVDFTLKKFPDYIATIVKAAAGDDEALVKGLKAAFIEHDKLIARQGALHYRDSGSTATVAIVGPKTCIIAYIGDSPACIFDPDTGKVLHTIGKHEPTEPGEHRRILKNGGHVSHDEGDAPRVNGCLMVSRAFGDYEFKFKSSREPEWEANWSTDFCVTAEPDVVVFPRPTKGVLAIFSDGLVEKEDGNMKPIGAVAVGIQQSVKAAGGDLKAGAEMTLKRHTDEYLRDSLNTQYDGDDLTLVLADIGLGSGVPETTERHTRKAKVKRVRTKTHVKRIPKTFTI